MRKPNLFIIVGFFFIATLAGFAARAGLHRTVQIQICGLVADKFYRNDEQLAEWYHSCRNRAREVSWWWPRDQFLKEVQWLLQDMQVSHLMIYDPAEDRRLWHGEATATGLSSVHIDTHFIVLKVAPKSVGEQMGFKAGDEIDLIDGEPPRSNWQIATAQGEFKVRRGDAELRISLIPGPLILDNGPRLKDLGGGVGLLEISSFRAEYFAAQEWTQISGDFGRFARLIVDLRGNAGGNVVAMLRGLSPFFCQVTGVGELSQPRRQDEKGPAVPDNLDDMAQLSMLERFRRLGLYTYPNYGCYRGSVTVLVDDETSSVSEIFAEAMRKRPRSRVWGRATAGDVLIATWYSLPLLGEGYSLSIPEALYMTTEGNTLEGSGVWPDQELEYELKEARAGADSWVLRAKER